MKKVRKMIAVLIMPIMIAGLISYENPAYAANEVNINCELVDSIVADRYWVIETLVNGNLSNNPTACANNVNQLICDELLESYVDNKALKALIHAMDVYANTGQYVSGFGSDVVKTFKEWFDVDSEDEALKLANDFIGSLEGLKYESILNEALQKNYESSTGRTLHETQSDLAILRQRANILKKIAPYTKRLRDYLGIVHTDGKLVYGNEDAHDISITDYAGTFLSAYGQDLSEYLNSVVSIPSLSGKDALKKKIISYSALEMVSMYEQTIATDNNDPYVLSNFEEYFCDDVMQILSQSGKALSLSSYAMDNALLLGALNAEKETTVNTLQRLANYTADQDLTTVLNRYAGMVEKEGNSRILNYENITGYVRNQTLITDLISKKIQNGIRKTLNGGTSKIYGSDSLVMTHSFASALSRAGAVIDISTWISNETTGIKDASKKMVLCEYLDRVISQTAGLFQKDLRAYFDSKTETNAKQVINDLELLKVLRLYGETLGQQAREIQANSWLGAIIGDDGTAEYMKQHYQTSIDSLLSCEANPIKNVPLTIRSGETLIVNTKALSNGRTISYGTLMRINNEMLKIPEVGNYLMGGVELNGGSLYLTDTDTPIAIPYIQSSGTSDVRMSIDNVYVGEISNSGNLSVGLYGEATDLIVSDEIENSGSLRLYGNEAQEAAIYCQNLYNSSNINMENAAVYAKGDVRNSGGINGKLCMQGDDTLYYQNGYFVKRGQKIYGSGNIAKLYLQNQTQTGTKIDGKQVISEVLSNTGDKVLSSKNLWLTGNCRVPEGTFGYDLSFQNYNGTQSLTVGGNSFLYGTVTFGGRANLNGNVDITDTARTVAFAKGFDSAGTMKIEGTTELTIGGESSRVTTFLNQGKTQIKTTDGNQRIIACGDIKNQDVLNASQIKFNVSGNAVNTSELHGCIDLCGTNAAEVQTLDGTGTIDTLCLNSTALQGVNIVGSQTITEAIQNTSTHVANSKKLTLTGTCRITNGYYNGALSFKDYTAEDGFKIKGDGFLSGSINFNGGATFGGSLQLTSSLNALTLGADCTVDGDMDYAGGTVSGNGWLKIKGDLSTGKSNLLLPQLLLQGKTAQKISGSSFQVDKISNANESAKGLQLGCEIRVNDIVYSTENAKYKNTEKLILTGKASVKGASIQLPISAEDWTYAGQEIKVQTIKANGTTTVEEKQVLTLNNYIQKSGTLNILTDGKLSCLSALQGETINNVGTISVKGDIVTNKAVSGGSMLVYGDYLAKADININELVLCGNTGQTFSNSSSTNVAKLAVTNRSKQGVTIESIIHVSDEYTKDCRKIVGENNIHMTGSSIGTVDKTYQGDVSIDDTFTIAEGRSTLFEGKLTLKSGSNLTIGENSTLTIARAVKMTGAKVHIQSGATLLVKHYADIANSEIVIEQGGRLVLKDDSKFDGTAVSGDGDVSISGDFNVISGTWKDVNLTFVGKLPQEINPKGINCRDVAIENPCRQGVNFISKLNYYGTLIQGTSIVSGSSNLVSCG